MQLHILNPYTFGCPSCHAIPCAPHAILFRACQHKGYVIACKHCGSAYILLDQHERELLGGDSGSSDEPR